MAAALDDATVLEDDDLVGVDHRRKPMGDHQRGAALRDLLQALLQRPLGAAVEGRGRLVEDQDRRVLEQDAGDGDPLLLAARQLETALADLRGIAVGQAGDEVVDLREPRRGLDFRRAGARPAIGDVRRRSVSLNSTVSCGTTPIARAQAGLGDRAARPARRSARRRRCTS